MTPLFVSGGKCVYGSPPGRHEVVTAIHVVQSRLDWQMYV